MSAILKYLVLAALGLTLGGASALWLGGILPNSPRAGNTINVQGWQSDWSIGSESADPYVRARVARNGLLALRKEEAVYFIAMTDDDGGRLRETCTYLVSGGAMPAKWWSITLYDADSRLPMNEDRRLSFDQTMARALFEDQGARWSFQISQTRPQDDSIAWVSSRAAASFDVMLRLYQPSAAILSDPQAELAPPSIKRLACASGAN
ncbi:MAG: DUF1214 domain-containing protein [Pseudomonadota bacterium]